MKQKAKSLILGEVLLQFPLGKTAQTTSLHVYNFADGDFIPGSSFEVNDNLPEFIKSMIIAMADRGEVMIGIEVFIGSDAKAFWGLDLRKSHMIADSVKEIFAAIRANDFQKRKYKDALQIDSD